ncbi:hypothetical protein GCM10023088_57330 [Actinomadura verrucosospora]
MPWEARKRTARPRNARSCRAEGATEPAEYGASADAIVTGGYLAILGRPEARAER